MNRMLFISTIALVIGIAGESRHINGQGSAPATRSTVQLLPADSVKWVTARPGQDSSVLWGDPRTGAYGRFNRFAAGFEDRPHFHTRDLRVVIVSGTMIVKITSDPTMELGPGSYALVPGGSVHTHSCKAGAACVLFVEQDGPTDTTVLQPN
jgi:mannose-6-phosphate isomerase-like protein (cupin superfamily)